MIYVIAFSTVFLLVWFAVMVYEAMNPKCIHCNSPMVEDGYGKMECLRCDRDRIVNELITLRRQKEVRKQRVIRMLSKPSKLK